MMRKLIRNIHLWLGMASGLVIFVVCMTGCIYAYQKEWVELIYPEIFVESSGAKASLSDLVGTYQKQYPERKVYRIYEFKNDPTHATILLTLYKGVYYFDYVNPYTHAFLFSRDLTKDFFFFILALHMRLSMGEVGHYIVGGSVLVFLVSLMTGLVLWFPKNPKVFKTKKGRQSRFGLKRKVALKRRIYDLHNVLGFYAATFLLIIALTGLGWTFKWFDAFLYRAVTFEKKSEIPEIQLDKDVPFQVQSLDVLSRQIDKYAKNHQHYIYYLPFTGKNYLKVVQYRGEERFGDSNTIFANPATGNIVKVAMDAQKTAGDKFKSLYYELHTGSILGLLGKTLAFVVSLVGASLPITGLWMYFSRKRRRQRR